MLKKFLQQVRESRGYDLDVMGPNFLNSPFNPVNLSQPTVLEEALNIAKEVVIEHINSMTEKVYKYVDTLKFDDSDNRIFLMTFTAKEDANDAQEQTFLAPVYAPVFLKEEFEMLECFLKPDGPAPTPTPTPTKDELALIYGARKCCCGKRKKKEVQGKEKRLNFN